MINRTRHVVVSLMVVGFAAGVVAIAASSESPAPAPTASAETPAPDAERHIVRVYYFHTTQRCASCKRIEAFSEAAIREGFGRELGTGTVEWWSLNLDEAPNRHYVRDYRLYTKSLVVVDFVNGRQARWKNLPKIWELLLDEAAFQEYVQAEVRAYLENRS